MNAREIQSKLSATLKARKLNSSSEGDHIAYWLGCYGRTLFLIRHALKGSANDRRREQIKDHLKWNWFKLMMHILVWAHRKNTFISFEEADNYAISVRDAESEMSALSLGYSCLTRVYHIAAAPDEFDDEDYRVSAQRLLNNAVLLIVLRGVSEWQVELQRFVLDFATVAKSDELHRHSEQED